MAGQAIAGLRRSDFEFELPPELIAQHPTQRRDGARLLHVHGTQLGDHVVREVPDFVRPGDVFVINDTRVVPARLRGHKPSGGRVELLVERPMDPQRAWCMVRTSHTPRPGQVFVIPTPSGAVRAEVLGRQEDLFELAFSAPLLDLMQSAGELPLPPYITHAPDAADLERYQTVYARAPGAVAAPTAGLHFTPELLEAMTQRGADIVRVTLHVGAGTFLPVRHEDLSQHRMHLEHFEIPAATADIVNQARDQGRRVTAIGTTSVRALESAARDGRLVAGPGDTRLFILPGFRFQIVDRLFTNFHLPASTLMMLVSAFAGADAIRAAYHHAIAQRYRFFSYGDAMLLERHDAI